MQPRVKNGKVFDAGSERAEVEKADLQVGSDSSGEASGNCDARYSALLLNFGRGLTPLAMPA